MRKLAERFQQSTETINRVYYKVIRCFLAKKLYELIIVAFILSTPLADKIQYNFKYFSWFKDCVGAIDGTYIPVSSPKDEKAMFRDQKGNLSQNVLVTCNLDM